MTEQLPANSILDDLVWSDPIPERGVSIRTKAPATFWRAPGDINQGLPDASLLPINIVTRGSDSPLIPREVPATFWCGPDGLYQDGVKISDPVAPDVFLSMDISRQPDYIFWGVHGPAPRKMTAATEDRAHDRTGPPGPVHDRVDEVIGDLLNGRVAPPARRALRDAVDQADKTPAPIPAGSNKPSPWAAGSKPFQTTQRIGLVTP